MRLALFVIVLALTAPPALAQVNTLEKDNPRENARIQFGPLYLTPRVALTELGVDTNVFNATGNPEQDFTFTLTPSAEIWVPIARRGLIKGTFVSDVVWYKEFASERSMDPSFSLRGEAYLRRFTVFAEGALLNSRQRPSFEVDLRSRRVENSATAGVDVRITSKVSVELHGTRSRTEFDGDAVFLGSSLAETLNRTSTGLGAVARYRLSGLTTFALSADAFEDRFPLSAERGSDNVVGRAGVEFQPRALINGSAYVGIRRLVPVDEARLPEFSGVVSDLSLSHTVLGATRVSVTHVRDVRYSFELSQPYFIDTGVGAGVRQALGPRFDVEFSVGRHTYNYRDLIGTAPTPSEERVDTIWNYGGSFGYRVGRSGRIGIGLTRWTRASTTRPSRNYDGLRIRTMATYGF